MPCNCPHLTLFVLQIAKGALVGPVSAAIDAITNFAKGSPAAQQLRRTRRTRRGWMWKQNRNANNSAGKRGVKKLWIRRYVVLEDGELKYVPRT